MHSKLQAANPHLTILTTDHPSFREYAEPLEQEPFTQLVEKLEKTSIPESGNVYVPSDSFLEEDSAFPPLKNNFYGGLDIQIGYCNGHNTMLNALEYHRGCEITVAASDFVLLLARFQDISDGRLDSEKVRAYYISKGECFSVYESTLHFSPCAVDSVGFRAGIVLLKDTNTPLETSGNAVFQQDKLLFMKNKWLIAHPDSIQAREKNAFAGIIGENIRVISV